MVTVSYFLFLQNKIYCRNDADSPLLAIAAFSPFRLRFYRSIEANVKLKAINNYSSTKITDDFYINRLATDRLY